MKPKTIKDTRLEAVEYELIVCPLCEQDYEPEYMVQIVTGPEIKLNTRHKDIDVSFGKLWSTPVEDLKKALTVSVHDESLLCPNCADTIGITGAGSGERVKVRSNLTSTEMVVSVGATLVLAMCAAIFSLWASAGIIVAGATVGWALSRI